MLLPGHRHTFTPVIQQTTEGFYRGFTCRAASGTGPASRGRAGGTTGLPEPTSAREPESAPAAEASARGHVWPHLREVQAAKLLGRSFAQLPEGGGEVGARLLHQLRTPAPIRPNKTSPERRSYLQQEGDEDAVVLFVAQEAQFGSEQLVDPEDQESNRSFSDIIQHLFRANVDAHLLR